MTHQVSKTADWTLIEADYRAGIKSLRTIAEEHGISHSAIRKRAERDSWARDLTAKTRARADAMVSTAAVSSQVSTGTGAAEKIPEKAIVEANATLQYQVRMSHRADVARGRRLWDRLIGELEVTGLDQEAIDRLLTVAGDEFTAKQRADAKAAIQRATAVGNRVSNFNTMVHALDRLVKMERVAFGIGDDGGEGDNPAHPAGAAPAGHGRGLSDAERAIRLARLLQVSPGVAALLPAAAPAAAVPVPPGRE